MEVTTFIKKLEIENLNRLQDMYDYGFDCGKNQWINFDIIRQIFEEKGISGMEEKTLVCAIVNGFVSGIKLN